MMIDTSSIVFFLMASMALIVTPGPDLIYVVIRSLSQGKSAGMYSAAGVTTGILAHTLAAGFGLAVLLKTSPTAFLIVKYIGAVYLIYLGLKAFQSKTELSLDEMLPHSPNRTLFLQGFISNALNPKVVLFFISFLPQFVNEEIGSMTMQMVVLGIIFAALTFMFLAALAITAAISRTAISNNSSFVKNIHKITGGVLVSLGVRLAFIEQI